MRVAATKKSKQAVPEYRKLTWILVLLCLDCFVEQERKWPRRFVFQWSFPYECCTDLRCLTILINREATFLEGWILLPQSRFCDGQARWCLSPRQHSAWGGVAEIRRRFIGKEQGKVCFHLICLHLWLIGVLTLFGIVLHFFTEVNLSGFTNTC